MSKRIITFDDIRDGVKDVVKRGHLKDQGYEFVLAVARGGLVPGTLMGYALGLPVLTIHWSAPTGNGDSEHNKWFGLQFDSSLKKKFLIVEDICDTGETLKHLVEYMDYIDQEFDSYAFCSRDTAVIKPTYYSQSVVPEISWVDFPWEI